MARQKRTKGRKQKQFGKLRWSALWKNAEQFVQTDGPAHAARILEERRRRGQDPGSCEYVPARESS